MDLTHIILPCGNTSRIHIYLKAQQEALCDICILVDLVRLSSPEVFLQSSLKLQVHFLEGGKIEIYSRNAEHNTGKFPDIVGVMPRYV